MSDDTLPFDAEEADADEARTLTVRELVDEVNGALRDRFADGVWVEGEISNLARPGSGHLYWSLKDAQSQVRCAMFRMAARGLGFELANGRQVLVRARASIYEARGEYQLVVDYAEEAGEGALRRKFEELKKRLAAEGLFDASRKIPLPKVPRRIGVVTSPTGAAVRDVLIALRRRFPATAVLVYPTQVQGAGAAEEIARTLALADKRADCDVLILTRGGGSLEDLWSFNEEVVARAVAAVKLPIIVGVGHEIDFTIADFVADLRVIQEVHQPFRPRGIGRSVGGQAFANCERSIEFGHRGDRFGDTSHRSRVRDEVDVHQLLVPGVGDLVLQIVLAGLDRRSCVCETGLEPGVVTHAVAGLGGLVDQLGIDHEIATNYVVKGKGLVVLTSCSHRGVINTVKAAQKASGVDKVHAVIGMRRAGKTTFLRQLLEEKRASNPPDCPTAKTVPTARKNARHLAMSGHQEA